MAERNLYRHLHIRGLGVASESFRAIGMGSEKEVRPVVDRAEHARILSEGLDAAVSDIDEYMAAQKASGVRKNKRGMPVTFEGRPDILLRVGQGRSSQGFALLNVRRKPVAGSDYEQKTDQATFFATPATLSTLRRNLEDYGNWVGSDDETSDEAYEDDTGRPRRFKLFESAALIRSTSVQDLWTDSLDRYPKRRDDFDWEVWTRADFQESFEQAVRALGLQFIGKPTPFVDTVVRGVTATHSQIQDIVRASAAVVGLRSASSFASDEQQFDLRVGTEALRRLIARVRWPGTGAPCVTLLDTGVRQDHPLLVGALPATRSFAVEPWWPTDDHHGHGTKMAGVTLYGDLAAVPQDDSPVQVETRLESVVVTAPPRMPRLPARDAIRRAVDAVEGGAVSGDTAN